MRSNNQKENQALTPMQKQAVLVCIVCALAALLTIGITLTMLKRGKNPTEQPGDSSIITPAPAPEGEEDISDHYQINETSSALLTGTADAGDAYQEQTLFIGDSNTVRLYANGLISLQQFCAKEGIGTGAALNEGIVTFKRDDNRYTIAQAVAKMKPRRVVIMLGTNDNGMNTEDFISNYTALVQAIQASYPYTDIIVNTVPPVPSNHSNYPNMDQTRIDDFNMALLTMCEQLGVKFLNSAEALKDANGYGNVDYYQSGDIHLKPAGLKVLLKYLRTHAYETEDRRPDTNNIPTRAEYTANPSSAVEAPSSSEVASSSAVEEKTEYQAGYRVDKTGGGTLTCGNESGKSLTVKVTSAAQTVTVTAVPEDGYVFVKWSDGVTKRTRTDTNFDQNVDVTAVFAAASIQISSSGKAVLGDSYTFKATLKGKYLDTSSIRWYVNGSEVTQAAGKTTVKGEVDPSMLGGTFRVYATASYNDCTVTSNKLELSVSGARPARPAAPAVPVRPLRRISPLLPRTKRLPPLRRTNRPLPRRRSPLLPPRMVLLKAPAAPPRWRSPPPLRLLLRKKSPLLLRRAAPPPRWKNLLLLSRSTRLPPRKMNRQPLKRKSPRPPRPKPAPARKLLTKGTFRGRAA